MVSVASSEFALEHISWHVAAYSCKKSTGRCQIEELCHDLAACLQKARLDGNEARPDLTRCLKVTISLLEDVEEQASILLAAVLQADLPARLLTGLDDLDFEARKEICRFFDALLSLGSRPDRRNSLLLPVVEYVKRTPSLPEMLLKGCARPEAVLHCGPILRALTQSPELVSLLLECGTATELMRLATHGLEVACDAFESLKHLLLSHKKISAAFIAAHFKSFFDAYHTQLLCTEESIDDSAYMIQRQALGLLGSILLDGAFAKVMQRYASSDDFLKIHMNLMLHQSKRIKVDAFHVFKIFVAQPDKPERVYKILCRNRRGLVNLLTKNASNLSQLAREADDETLMGDLAGVCELLASMAG
eukprot:TRINITY_DN24303_c0_g1_i1.p1 TRINITY_DN24303_c0_g1~~TRINITY_DN24303_c0_g1_i1.p1  ORF type:complete len:362 (-),score=70.34 TRINITY_DN24303_c0_g1_i1:71-1156(-)